MTLFSGTEALHVVASHLKGWLDDVVFVGGAVTPLLITDPAAYAIRPTDDIDVIVEVTTRRRYEALEEELRKRGFRHDASDGAPICRWLLGTITVDVMPTDPDILGFSNRWYLYALRTASLHSLDENLAIRLISPVAFLATKIEAFRSPHRRFGGDFRASHDLEDVLTLLDGRPELDREIVEAEPEVRHYLSDALEGFLAEPAFIDALGGHLEPGPTNEERSYLLLERLKRLAER